MSLIRNISKQTFLPVNMLLIFMVPIFLITSDVRIAFNSVMLYEYGFDKYNVSGDTGLSKDTLMGIAADIKDYFNSDNAFLDIKIIVAGQEVDLFNEKEIKHMKDVKGVLSKMNKVQEISGLYVLIYLFISMTRNKFRWPTVFVNSIVRGCLLTLVLVSTLAVGIFVGFDSLFEQFHIALFEAGTWTFDPRTNYLTRLFTEAFFMDASLLIGVSVFIQASLMYLVLWFARMLLSRNSIRPD
tara:strand:+ start:72 stop:794 length:723 start_codon:yes stop_codon:yes gene_type:complete